MSEYALPCIRCGDELKNVVRESDNQPNSGTAFESYGHYGSTVFDPMNGTAIEITLCDECLLMVAKEGRVGWSRRYLPITCDNVIVGRQWVDRPMVPWKPEVEAQSRDDEVIEIDVEEVGVMNASRIEWAFDLPRLVEFIKENQDRKDRKGK